MKKILTVITILLSILVLVSCTNDVSDPMDDKVDSWEDMFRQYWETMSLEYVHFSEEEGLDWDKVYEEYLPKFQALNYEKTEDTMTAFSLFKEIAWQLHDYHYALIVSDKSGNKLQFSPAALQKWKKANPDGDIDDYPDVYMLNSDGESYALTSVNRVKKNEDPVVVNTASPTPDEKDKVRESRKTTEGAYEISDLTESGAFHNGDSGFKANCFVGGTITAGDKADCDTDEKKAWYTVVNGLGLEGFTYFYGLTTDGYFYFYLSEFPQSLCLNPLLYQEKLSATERASLDESGLSVIHDVLWCQNMKPSVSYDLSPKMAELGGILNLIQNLRYIGSSDKCSFDGYSFHDVKGVIMDVRSNSGGAADFLFTVMGSFFSEKTKVGEVRYRDGYSRYNYTPWTSYYLEDSFINSSAKKNYDKPFVVIANGSSVSCSEISCIIAKLLPNSKIVGGQTYGGTCALSDRTIYQSGPFKTDQIYIYTTTFQAIDSNGVNLETKGITPDVPVEAGTSSDARYEKALEIIKTM